MFCEKCGAKNSSSNKFCEKCGNKLVAEETKKTVKKDVVKENTQSIKDKINSLSKKQKIIGGVIIAVVIVLVTLYIVGSKMTSLETIGSKAFEELADKSSISNKYLLESLDSDDYFISLGETLKNKIEDEEIEFNYDNYTVKTTSKKVTVKYRDTDEKENVKVVFDVKKEGKSLLVFDKYVITKVTVVKGYDSDVLYDPDNAEKITLKAVKGSKITIDEKEVNKKYIDSKKSDKEKDVYVIRGISKGSYKVEFTVGKLSFEKKIYVYSDENNEYDLANYISSSYMKDEGKELAKEFKNYITSYYENVNDTAKTVDDFDKKYKVTDDIKDTFEDSKEYASKLSSFKIDDVTLRSLYYYQSDKEISISYKVNYTYKMADSEEEKTNYSTVRVTYDLTDLTKPKELSYMPY